MKYRLLLAALLCAAFSLEASQKIPSFFVRAAQVVQKGATLEIANAVENCLREYQQAMALAVQIRKSWGKVHELKCQTGVNILLEAERKNFEGLSRIFHQRVLPGLDEAFDTLDVVLQQNKEIDDFVEYSLKDEKNAAQKTLYDEISASEDIKELK